MNCSYSFDYMLHRVALGSFVSNHVQHLYLSVVDSKVCYVVNITFVGTNYAFYFQVNAFC